MQLTETNIAELAVLTPTIFEDHRGKFFESYHQKKFAALGIGASFVQDNQSFSKYGTVRGLHYQCASHAQAKLVQVVAGEILDVAVDLRKGSTTFGQWQGIKLSAENKKQFFIPKGFAHGFCVHSKQATVLYKCDAFYNPAAEQGIIFNDPTLAINWQIAAEKIIVSEKDRILPTFQKFCDQHHA